MNIILFKKKIYIFNLAENFLLLHNKTIKTYRYKYLFIYLLMYYMYTLSCNKISLYEKSPTFLKILEKLFQIHNHSFMKHTKRIHIHTYIYSTCIYIYICIYFSSKENIEIKKIVGET